MMAPLRADESPRVKCDEDMFRSCLEFTKMHIGSVDDVLHERSWTSKDKADTESEQLTDGKGPVHPVDELVASVNELVDVAERANFKEPSRLGWYRLLRKRVDCCARVFSKQLL